jgi:hypothetical protein
MQEARAVSKYYSFSKEPLYIYALISIILTPEEEVLLLYI